MTACICAGVLLRELRRFTGWPHARHARMCSRALWGRLCGGRSPGDTTEYAPVVGQSPALEAGGGSRRAAAAAALLEDCEEVDEDGLDEEELGTPKAQNQDDHAMLATQEEIDEDAEAIYGMGPAEESGQSPRYDLPHDLGGDVDDEIGPDDSISVAWFKAHKPQQTAPARPGLYGAEPVPSADAATRSTPVTIEAPDGSRHAMDVELDGLQNMAELRRGMLQGYRELLGENLPANALRVHARLASGSSILLLDTSPLSQAVINARSFYVWAARDALGEDMPAQESVSVPSISQRKDRLAKKSNARIR